MQEIAKDNPNAARALFIPLSICQMIECVVAPIFVILEELYLMLSGQEWEGAYIPVNVLKLIVSPFFILGTFYSLMCGLSNPIKEIKSQQLTIENDLNKPWNLKVRMDHPDFPEEVADHFYKTWNAAEDKRDEIVQKIASELAECKQLDGSHILHTYNHLMHSQIKYLSEFMPINR